MTFIPPWQQPQPMSTQQPYPAQQVPPLPSYPAQSFQPQPLPPSTPTTDPMTQVFPLIQQANAFLPYVTAAQHAILLVIAAVAKRTNSHPYFPMSDDQADMQILHQLHAIEPQGTGYILTVLGDALIVAERLKHLMAFA